MKDPYVYPHTNILKNKANIQDEKMLSCMEAEYTSLRLAELVTRESAGRFDFSSLCDMHHYIFQDVYVWAGKIRIINIEKAEPALGGISIEYSDCFDIERDAVSILKDMNHYPWETDSITETAKAFSGFLAKLWRIHPYREGNTRTIVTFILSIKKEHCHVNLSLLQCSSFFSMFYLEQRNNSSSHLRSTSFWNASIRYSFSFLNRCLNLPCGFKNSSIGSFFFGS